MTSISIQRRIDDVLQLVIRFGQIDGEHHQRWLIDQVVRGLSGGVPEFDGGEVGGFRATEDYHEQIRRACDGEDGPDTYDWDQGIAP
jgi:hypothetical protein